MKRFLLTLLLSVSFVFGYSQNIPEPTGHVNDYANVISDDEEAKMENQLRAYNDSTSIEIAVVTITDLEGYDETSYAQTLFEKWGIGKKETNAGLLILIAPNDRRWRIHTGYGLEPFITDYEAKRIGENNFPEHFKKEEYYLGIQSGVDDIINKLGTDSWELRQEYLAQKEKQEAEERAATKRTFLNVLIVFVAIGLFIMVILIRREQIRKKEALKNNISKYRTKITGVRTELSNYINNGVKVTTNKDYFVKEANSILKEIDDDILSQTKATKETLDSLKSHYEEVDDKYDSWTVKHNMNTKILSLQSSVATTVATLGTKYDRTRALYDKLVKNYGNIVSERIKGFRLDKSYYEKNYMDNITKAINKSKDSLEKSNFSLANKYLTNYDSKIKAFDYEMNKVHKMETTILESKSNIKIYEKEIKPGTGTLYSKVERLMKDSDVESSTKRKWKSVKTKIAKYESKTAGLVDFIYVASILMALINDIKSVRRRAQSDIDDAERERRRVAAAAAAALAASRSSSSSSSYGGYGGGGGGFGGFGGGSSGGGGASGGW